ncbi:MAG: hypothetical protein VYE71_00440, partial [Pseudomonadota bacterium]|nr:hypothetical protein [Pseudomonadota bacterium]
GSCYPGYCEQFGTSSNTHRSASLLAARGIHKRKDRQEMAVLRTFTVPQHSIITRYDHLIPLMQRLAPGTLTQ